MARERGRQRSVEFELLPDTEDLGRLDEPGQPYVVVAPTLADEDRAAAVIEPSFVAKAARRTWAWLRGRTPLQLVAAAVVVALAAGAGVAADHAQDRARVARLTAARGGVVDLSPGEQPVWSVDLDVEGTFDGGGFGVTTVLDGGVLVVAQAVGEMVREEAFDGETTMTVTSSDGTTTITGGGFAERFDVRGHRLHGIDAATGEILWTHRNESPQLACTTTAHSIGPSGVETSRTSPALVCVTGQGADTEVTVIDPAGTATTVRPDDVGESTRFHPGPDDLLWRFDWVADLPDDQLPALADGGADRSAPWLLSGTEPRTGEVLWQRLMGTTDRRGSAECLVRDDHGLAHPSRILTMWSSGRHVTVWGCDFGELIGAGGLVSATDHGGVVRSDWLADGGLAQLGMEPGASSWSWPGRPGLPQTVLDDHGTLFADLEGSVLDPVATDGRGGVDLSVPQAERPGYGALVWTDGDVIGAVDGHGEELWRVPVEQEFVDQAVARAGNVVVLQTSWSMTRGAHLVALDQRTGDRVWEVPMGAGAGMWASMLVGAWTDGDVLVVATPQESDDYAASHVWTAYDLRNGRMVWERTFDDGDPSLGWRGVCTSATGALVCVGGGRVTRLA